METKPFSIQSPETIAKEYGGNKQKIAQAMQMGIVDPTAGTLAGMFIDRMRSAAQQEQAPQQTVAQQVMATQPTPPPPPPPPAPPAGSPAGLGATPEAAQMMASPMQQAMAPPPMEQPMGMAEGGMVPPYMNNGGLAELPVPDTMFDEPKNGSYASGGIVALAAGTPGKAKTAEELAAEAKAKPPESMYGNFKNPEAQREYIQSMYKPEREASTALTDMFKGVGSPEELQRRKKEDMYMMLAKVGATMANTPGDFLQALGAGIGEALPGAAQAAKERRTDQRDALKTVAAQEGLNNKEALDLYKLVQEGTNKYGEFDMARLTREQQVEIVRIQEKDANYRASVSADASRYGSNRQYDATVKAAGLSLDRENARISQLAVRLTDQKLGPGGEYAVDFSKAQANGTGAAYRRQKIAEEVAILNGDRGDGDGAGVIRYGVDGRRI